MASWASWALPRERYAGGASGTYSRPTRAVIHARASAWASRATRTESVRMYVMRPSAPSAPRSMPS